MKEFTYLLYKCDAYHSNVSKVLFAVTDDYEMIGELVDAKVKYEGGELTEDDRNNLISIDQTQNYIGDGEFIIEMIENNKLIQGG